MKNDQPFQHPEIANHFGDIDVYNGEIYCGVENSNMAAVTILQYRYTMLKH